MSPKPAPPWTVTRCGSPLTTTCVLTRSRNGCPSGCTSIVLTTETPDASRYVNCNVPVRVSSFWSPLDAW